MPPWQSSLTPLDMKKKGLDRLALGPRKMKGQDQLCAFPHTTNTLLGCLREETHEELKNLVTDIKKGTKQRQNRTKPSTRLERA
ncbi:hypothetical protein Tco_0484733 [Tanacetum coccineum]